MTDFLSVLHHAQIAQQNNLWMFGVTLGLIVLAFVVPAPKLIEERVDFPQGFWRTVIAMLFVLIMIAQMLWQVSCLWVRVPPAYIHALPANERIAIQKKIAHTGKPLTVGQLIRIEHDGPRRAQVKQQMEATQ
ncbi:hypothetical protein AAE485_01565 [Acidithiobacillus ferriphilus]|uniref:hypothetical protein n=1 Tax=Acidithiobacillus ferriphilus TaxID=1689834 RepID=UPI00390C9A72